MLVDGLDDPQAPLLWIGLQGDVSPSWMADRAQASTWNYACAQCATLAARIVAIRAEPLQAHCRFNGGRPDCDTT